MLSANTRLGLLLAGSAGGIYLFTIYHLKKQAPGNLEEMVPLPPSEAALRDANAAKAKAAAAVAETGPAK